MAAHRKTGREPFLGLEFLSDEGLGPDESESPSGLVTWIL